MKKKRFNKKLALKKKTIANLSLSDMVGMRGGLEGKPSNPFICGTAECYYAYSRDTNCDCDPEDTYGNCGPTVDPNETCVPCTFQTQCRPCNP